MRVMTFSRHYPKYHPKAGEPTYFVEKIWKCFLDQSSPCFPYWMNKPPLDIDVRDCYEFDPKGHTIRAGNRWKVGDWFSPRVWSGKPYASKQIEFAPPIQVKKIWTFGMDLNGVYSIDGKYVDNEDYERLAQNDGLNEDDMFNWFMPNYSKPVELSGQIICWDERIEY